MSWRGGFDTEDGSILVEALVATAVVGLVLGSAYEVVRESAARHQKVEARRYALMVAQSALAAAGSAIPLAGGVSEGRDGPDIWRVESGPCGSGRSTTGVLYCVSASVSAAEGGPPLVVLQTRRLAALQ